MHGTQPCYCRKILPFHIYFVRFSHFQVIFFSELSETSNSISAFEFSERKNCNRFLGCMILMVIGWIKRTLESVTTIKGPLLPRTKKTGPRKASFSAVRILHSCAVHGETDVAEGFRQRQMRLLSSISVRIECVLEHQIYEKDTQHTSPSFHVKERFTTATKKTNYINFSMYLCVQWMAI